MTFLCNPSWYVWVLFKILKPFIDPVTASKINFVDLRQEKQLKQEHNEKQASKLEGMGGYKSILDYIDADQLLVEYGGSFVMPWHFESYWDAISKI